MVEPELSRHTNQDMDVQTLQLHQATAASVRVFSSFFLFLLSRNHRRGAAQLCAMAAAEPVSNTAAETLPSFAQVTSAPGFQWVSSASALTVPSAPPPAGTTTPAGSPTVRGRATAAVTAATVLARQLRDEEAAVVAEAPGGRHHSSQRQRQRQRQRRRRLCCRQWRRWRWRELFTYVALHGGLHVLGVEVVLSLVQAGRGGLVCALYGSLLSCVWWFACRLYGADPGWLPQADTPPASPLWERHRRAIQRYGALKEPCHKCGIDRPARSRHCWTCDRCVSRFDHHCVWVGSCIGESNHGTFLIFLLVQAVHLVTAAAALIAFDSACPVLRTTAWLSAPHCAPWRVAMAARFVAVLAVLFTVFVVLVSAAAVYHMFKGVSSTDAVHRRKQ